MKKFRILGIETSCDETSAAVVAAKFKNQNAKCKMTMQNAKITILSNIVASQIDIHKKYGGVYPELASRAHLENIIPVIQAALYEAKLDFSQVDAIAVTIGPGLIGSLLIGVETAKTLAYAFNKPLIPINHLEGHIAANFIGGNKEHRTQNRERIVQSSVFPILCLIVSGGHTSLVLMKDFGKYKTIGSTRDDAAGEAFDKVAQILGLSYPGGPAIEKAAQNLEPRTLNLEPKIFLPRPMIDSDDFDFSFSGLKTAVLRLTKELGPTQMKKFRNQIASEFQQAVVDVLVSKTLRATKKYQAKTIMLSGGVAANSFLRKGLKAKTYNLKANFLVPPKNLCTDNAAMIAAAALLNYPKSKKTDLFKITAQSNFAL